MGYAEIVSSIAVLISAGTLWVALRRFNHERQLEDRKDARSTLAGGALELGRTKAVMKDAFTAFQLPRQRGRDWPTDFGEHIGRLERANEALELALAAVRIRFAHEDDVVTELSGAWGSVRSLISVYVIALGEALSEHESNNLRDDRRDAFKLGEGFDAHRDRYLAAAQQAVGVKLP